jgi:hypothetical protein
MRRLFLVVLLLALAVSVSAQQRWERTYGGPYSDEGYSVQQTNDGGYIAAGYAILIPQHNKVYLIKTNAFGDTLWTKTYGGGAYDFGRCVKQTQDGGYIVVGNTNSFGHGSWDVYLIKTNASGDTLWTRTYGGPSMDGALFVQQTSDRGYIIAGSTVSFGDSFQVYLIKINTNCDTLWSRAYGGTELEFGYSVQQTSDGGYIIVGQTNSFGAGYDDVYLIKTNALGDTLWTRTYGGASWDEGYSVQQTSDGGYIITGGTQSFGNNGQVFFIKTNATGDTLWTRTYGGAGDENGSSVQQTADGGYIISGSTTSFGNGTQVYLLKINANGDTVWTRTYGGTGTDNGYSVQQTLDGGYIIAARTNSFGNDGQVYLIKTDANGSSGVEENKEVRGQRLGIRLTATPNPFTSFTTVPDHSSECFTLFDISGRRVGVFRGDRIGEGLSPGVYFLRAECGKAKPLRIVKIR